MMMIKMVVVVMHQGDADGTSSTTDKQPSYPLSSCHLHISITPIPSYPT